MAGLAVVRYVGDVIAVMYLGRVVEYDRAPNPPTPVTRPLPATSARRPDQDLPGRSSVSKSLSICPPSRAQWDAERSAAVPKSPRAHSSMRSW